MISNYRGAVVPAHSSEFLYEVISHECLACQEAIYNPVCPRCLARAFREWFIQIDGNKQVLDRVYELVEQEKEFEGISQTCVVCHQDNAYLCPYCFTEEILQILKKYCSQAVVDEFLDVFNFDLGDFEGRWGYGRKDD
ncbi:MAG: hypothetical protein ACP5D2_03070 [Candidatus Nanoarchaeia archaeon]